MKKKKLREPIEISSRVHASRKMKPVPPHDWREPLVFFFFFFLGGDWCSSRVTHVPKAVAFELMRRECVVLATLSASICYTNAHKEAR